ncbi:MAG: pilus assembly protein N-terminal domain-containing protein [Negativicutes bacterium]|nr:pilus assembly protein N-terminal domain-containing protein [Negativicutes bacterium]
MERYELNKRRRLVLMIIRQLKISCIALMAMWMLAAPVQATNKIMVLVDHSVVLAINSLESIAVGNPEIADVVVMSTSEVLVVGKTPGFTSVQIWSADGRTSYEVQVGSSELAEAGEIGAILDYTGIRVRKVNKTVILEGTVKDQNQRTRAEKVAAAYGEKVVNLLEIKNPIQVKIEAKIIEISKDRLENLGATWGNGSPGSNPGVFALGQSSTNGRISGQAFGWFGTYSEINAQLEALIQEGSARILSQPNIVTASGEKASILVGGEIPIPISGGNNGQVAIDWKTYGIKLEIAPEVNNAGAITSKMKAEVSSLDYVSAAKVNLGNGLVIPSLKTRRAEAVVTLASGQTMAIGGLIGTEDEKSVSRLPLLSDLPVLGKLFTSTSFTSGKTELIIFMTPTLVSP